MGSELPHRNQVGANEFRDACLALKGVTYQGLLQLCVRARDLAPNWWYILHHGLDTTL